MKKIKILFALFCIALAHAQAPTTAPPTPPVRTGTDVISIYGEAYTNLPNVTTNPDWGGGTQATEVTIAGNKVLQYTPFNYKGTDWVNATNVTSMDYLHVDIWTDTQTPRLFIISKTTGDGNGYTFTSKPGQWQSVDIPLTYFTGNKTNVYQFKFDSGSGGTIYLDNLYFWKAPAGSDATLTDLKVAGTTISGFSAATTSYTVKLAQGAATPQITAVTTKDAAATTTITQATGIPGTATVEVTSQNGTVTKTYTVNFIYKPANTACAGEDTNAGFNTGYTYSFETVSPTSVKVTFVLLDTTGGIVGSNGDFQLNGGGFIGLSRSGNTYTGTATGLTNGQSCTFMGHFVWAAGGNAATKTYTYKVGTICDTTAPTGLTATTGTITTSSVELLLNASDDSNGTITYNITYDGGKTASTTGPSGTAKNFTINGLTPGTAYTFNVTASDAATPPNTSAAVQVSATTSVVADTIAPTGFTATIGAVTSTSIELLLNATDDSAGTITYNITGDKTTSTTSASGTQKSFVITGLTPSTLYNFSVTASDATGNTATAITLSPTTALDTQAPTVFTATVGAITNTSIELLLNATDDSVGTITYNVTGDKTATTTSTSGTQKSLLINGLTPGTSYSFNVTASDAASNTTAPFTLSAKTNSACAGKDTNTGFTIGYTYDFTTVSSTSVKVTFVVLDADKNTSNGDMQVNGAGFVGLSRTGDTYTATVTGLTSGQSCTFMGHFVNGTGAYSAKTYTYVVGDDCMPDTTAPTSFTATAGAITPTSVELLLNSTDASGPITYDVTYDGGKTATITEVSGTQKSLIINDLTPETAYTFSVTAKDAKGNITTTPVLVNATTIATPDTQAPADFTAIAGTITPTSVELLLNSTDASGPITYDVTYDGGKTATITEVSGTQKSLIINDLTPETAYTFSITAKDAVGNITTTPVLVNATTIATPDTQAPADFTAIAGTITPTSVELLLNSTDASGPITYDVTYDGGKTATITEVSGTQKSLIINDLTPETAYTFSVTAKDAKGNITTTPVLVNATTTATVVDTNTECAGTSSETIDGDKLAFGYNYSFTTKGTSVTMTFELLDTKDGLVAYSFRQNPFAETQMTPAGGQKFTQTITGLTIGSQITYACKFAYAGGMAVTKYFTYTVGNNCGASEGDADTQAPTGFTASVGNTTATSVELLLNGTDDSGAVVYNVTYGAGLTASITGNSGAQTSLVISGLTPETAYTFSVTAADATDNVADNNPIVLQATTLADTNTECAGTSSAVIDGTPLTLGYNYSFETIGTDVTITFEMLDTKDGLVAYSFRQEPFAETPMTNAGGQKFTQTITGLTVGSQITYACKFAYAGGMSVTKYFTYTVGNTCTMSNHSNDLSKSVTVYPNPARDILHIESGSSISRIEFYSTLGTKVLESSVNNNSINIETLPNGVYMLRMYTENNELVIKKLIVE